MTSTVLDLAITGTLFALAIREFFAWLKARNGNSNRKTDLAQINTQLSNHIRHLSDRVDRMEESMRDISGDIKIIKNNLEDIKIAIKK